MKKKIIRIGLIILALLLLWGGVWLAIEFNKNKIQINDIQSSLDLEHALKMRIQNDLLLTKGELNKTKQELDAIQKKLAASEAENSKLVSEKKALEARFHSLKELKKAIRQVKIEMRDERRQQSLAKRQLQKEVNVTNLIMGNRGLLCKDGKSTYKPTVKIEVHQAD